MLRHKGNLASKQMVVQYIDPIYIIGIYHIENLASRLLYGILTPRNAQVSEVYHSSTVINCPEHCACVLSFRCLFPLLGKGRKWVPQAQKSCVITG